MHSNSDLLNERLAEAARYALLRRLAPALRHDMAGVLQPVSMMAAILEKRLQKPEPDLLALAKNTSAIHALAREAATSCMRLMTWIAPLDDAPVPVHTGVAQTLELVATALSFQGFNLVNEIHDLGASLPLSLFRGVYLASLLALTDACSAPAQVLLRAELSGAALLLSMTVYPLDGDQPSSTPAAGYRSLLWDDVQALAAPQGVELTHGASAVQLRCSFVQDGHGLAA